jgi:DNA mismatch repair ATPase MutS
MINERQKAVLELKNMPDLRQHFIAEALSVSGFLKETDNIMDITQEKLLDWSNSIFPIVHKKIIKFLLILFPIFVLLSLTLSIVGFFSFNIPIFFGLINLTFIGLFLKKINRAHERLSSIVNDLKKIEKHILIIENEEFNCLYLNNLKVLLNEQKNSSELIRKLYKTLQAFDWRLNMIAGVILNGLLLWDLQILNRLEKLKYEFKSKIDQWFEVVGEFDALISLSNYAFNHPDFIFPEISDEVFTLEFKKGGHPLLPDEIRIDNDFQIIGLHKMTIVTGANMAGKSTFLRTVNINMILGACGAPVCASYFKFSPVALYTSIRTDDSLSKNESYFFAELMRLKTITDLLKEGKTMFITLDEMLKGTNSKDKHKGSYALIEQLIKYKASGLAATHDVQLGKLAEVYPDNINNMRFEVEIRGEDIHFDYQLKEGISQNLNASFLMQKYGIIE